MVYCCLESSFTLPVQCSKVSIGIGGGIFHRTLERVT